MESVCFQLKKERDKLETIQHFEEFNSGKKKF